MNRQQRRAARIRDPKGDWLYPELLYVRARDAQGRPTEVRITYDDETVSDVCGDDKSPVMLLVWMPEHRPS